MCPRRGKDPASGQPKRCRWGGVPHRQFGVTTWMHLANGEGCCPPLCGPDMEQ